MLHQHAAKRIGEGLVTWTPIAAGFSLVVGCLGREAGSEAVMAVGFGTAAAFFFVFLLSLVVGALIMEGGIWLLLLALTGPIWLPLLIVYSVAEAIVGFYRELKAECGGSIFARGR